SCQIAPSFQCLSRSSALQKDCKGRRALAILFAPFGSRSFAPLARASANLRALTTGSPPATEPRRRLQGQANPLTGFLRRAFDSDRRARVSQAAGAGVPHPRRALVST